MSTIPTPEARLSTIERAPSLAKDSASESKNTASSIILCAEVQPVFKPGRGFLFAFISICIITLAAALDATSLSIALPIITEKLHGTALEAFWAGTSFLLTSAVFQPVIAGLSHVFGRKDLIIISSLFFSIGSVVAAVSTNFTMMYVEGVGSEFIQLTDIVLGL